MTSETKNNALLELDYAFLDINQYKLLKSKYNKYLLPYNKHIDEAIKILSSYSTEDLQKSFQNFITIHNKYNYVYTKCNYIDSEIVYLNYKKHIISSNTDIIIDQIPLEIKYLIIFFYNIKQFTQKLEHKEFLIFDLLYIERSFCYFLLIYKDIECNHTANKILYLAPEYMKNAAKQGINIKNNEVKEQKRVAAEQKSFQSYDEQKQYVLNYYISRKNSWQSKRHAAKVISTKLINDKNLGNIKYTPDNPNNPFDICYKWIRNYKKTNISNI